MLKKLILLGIVFSLTTLASCRPVAKTQVIVPANKMVIGYYPAWAVSRNYLVKDIPVDHLTHINYAFSNVSLTGECILGDPAADVEHFFSAEESVSGETDRESAEFQGNFNQILQLKEQSPDLKVLISVGGWNWSANFSAAARDATSRQHFVASCIDLYFNQYPGVFDGVDIDWEYPVSGGLVNGAPEDRTNFTLLLQEFRKQLNELGNQNSKDYLLTIAAPIGPGVIHNLDLPGIAESVDWINLMTYDFHGTWDTTTNFNAPLYRSANDPADAALNVDAAVQTYLSNGISPDQLVLGVPFYGKGWARVESVENGLYQPAAGAAPGTSEAGSYTYNDLKDHYLPNWSYFWQDEAFTPWLYNAEEKTFISFDDPRSLEAKAGYAKDQGLAGVMIWELSQGDSSLLEAIFNGFRNGGPEKPVLPLAVQVPRPFESELHRVEEIFIDGILSEWGQPPQFILNDAAQVVFSANPTSWSGSDDLSAQIWAGWNEKGLYFAFHVIDDVHVQSATDETLWHGDHIEIQLDTNLEKDYDNPGMNGDDYQIGISAGDFGQNPPVAYAWFNGENLSAIMPSTQIACLQTDTGVDVEVFIPVEALTGLALHEGATIGMNISPSDSDSVGGGQEVMLSTSSIRTYADPRTFGKITLIQ